jgi:hypothetical protein
MYNVVGRSDPTYLLEDPKDLDVIAVPMEMGNGVVPRGCVAFRKDTGFYAPAGAADITEDSYLVVLDQEVNTDVSDTAHDDARAFRAARLIRDYVTLKDGEELTWAHVKIMRKQNLLLNPMMDDGEGA